MSNDARNVKLGVCNVFKGGEDLGLTKGGVEITIETQTHEVQVDQYGQSDINEIVMGRTCSAKVPLAETTIQSLLKVMPGASLVSEGGAKATGKLTVATNPSDGDTVTVNGIVFTFKTAGGTGTNITIGANAAATATALANALTASQAPALTAATYSAAAGVVTITAKNFGASGNSFTLASGQASVTTSGAKLTGGANVTKMRVVVPTANGASLLDYAQELRFHPISMPVDDLSEDFVMPLAATPGSLTYAYQVDQERIFECTFKAYPDINNGGILFYVGA